MTGPIILPHHGKTPKIHQDAFIAPGAVIIGDVEIGADSSIWFGCVLRGDVNVIRIGQRSNLQDGTIVHVAAAGQGTYVGNDVTVGHAALLHACTLDDNSFVGIRATVLDAAKVCRYGVVAAGALLTGGKTVPEGQLWAGSPAKFWREVGAEERNEFDYRARQYVALAKTYQ